MMVILVMCGIFCATIFVIRLHHKRALANSMEVDTLSITSSTMEQQFSDVESVGTVSSRSIPVVKPVFGDIFTIENSTPPTSINRSVPV